MTTKQLDVIILAGGLKQSPLRSELKLHELCLPIAQNISLLGVWMEAIKELPQCKKVVIAVSNKVDAFEIQKELGKFIEHKANLPDIQVIVESGRWRGTAGVLRDVAQEYAKSEVLLAVEAACYPPENLASIVSACDLQAAGVVGITHRNIPVGVYAFHRSVMKHVPSLGFFDVKEQLLPQMYAKKIGAQALHITDNFIRILDRQTYISAMSNYAVLHENMTDRFDGKIQQGIQTFKILDACIIDPASYIGNGAVLRQSIVLSGAMIGENAVINESIIGPGVVVPNDGIVSQIIVTKENNASIIGTHKGKLQRSRSNLRAVRK